MVTDMHKSIIVGQYRFAQHVMRLATGLLDVDEA